MICTPKILQNYISMYGSISGYFSIENQNHLAMAMQFLNIGENDGVLIAVVEEEIQRYMLVLLFHIPLFCISFIVCICVHLVYCM
jgi:hypothetical protein